MLRFWSHFHQYSHGNVILIYCSSDPMPPMSPGITPGGDSVARSDRVARSISIWCPILKKIEDDHDQAGGRNLHRVSTLPGLCG